MGCRNPSKKFPIDHVINTPEAGKLLDEAEVAALFVFDEAQYFNPAIVEHWIKASARGIDVLVSTPSRSQLDALADTDYEHIKMAVRCGCDQRESSHVIYREDLVYPTHLCSQCYEEHMNTEVRKLLDVVKEAEPFGGELHTYQPFYDIDMTGWELVRNDCSARLNIVMEAASRCDAVKEKLSDPVQKPAFVDLGCCSGFFSHGMSAQGFLSAGVDVSKDFINWASQVALMKGQAIDYLQQDVLAYLEETDQHFDVISTFATIQWVMAQQGYEAGLKCFERIFEKADSICVIEMGYTTEDIYKEKIQDRPVEIDKEWVMNLMESSGLFDTIEFHPSGEAGIWRDIFVGFKQKPLSPQVFDDLPVSGATQSSNARGYWDDGWAGRSLEVGLRSNEKLSRLVLEGWRPNDSVSSTMMVIISGEAISSSEVKDGIFRLELPIELKKDELFHLKVTNTSGFTPEDDIRPLCFVLRELSFS